MLKALANRIGLSVHRWPASRFDAMDDALELVRARGFLPRVVVDVGANAGQWSSVASRVFPDAAFHLIEAQAGLAQQLQQRFAPGNFNIHTTAVTRPGVSSVRMSGIGSTGAWVMGNEAWQHDAVVPATTLDALVADAVRPDDRALLKLDVEGHELEVLEGATKLLPKIEVVVSEVLFYDIESAGRPVFLDIAAYLNDRGFQLFDFAALGSRARDRRLRIGDALFVRKNSPLALDNKWA
jgi:FkbM family methyltransferase